MNTGLDRRPLPVVTLKPPTATGVLLGRKIVKFHQVGGAIRLHTEPPLRVIVRYDPIGAGRGSTLLSADGGHGESYRLQATYRNQKEVTDETRMEECADSTTRNRRVPLRGSEASIAVEVPQVRVSGLAAHHLPSVFIRG